ncbi:MAG: DUF2332 family protein, partial [Pseudomonadota bacterium]
DWDGPPDAMGDSVPLRLAGALHALVRRGRVPDLAKLYPPHALPDVETLTEAALTAIAYADAEIVEWLSLPPQTNEVGRSGALYPGLMAIAAETGLPVQLFEIGASAGLNLMLDRYAYKFGDRAAGDVTSPVTLRPNFSGSLPAYTEPRITSKRGCDRQPIDVSEAIHRERLLAYIWPDQPERIARAEAAIALWRAHGPKIERRDAADWCEDIFAKPGDPGNTRVLFHSIAFQYFPDQAKARIATAMETAGRAATNDMPLAWLTFEQRDDAGPHLTLRTWPGDRFRVLARADAHVRKLQWFG